MKGSLLRTTSLARWGLFISSRERRDQSLRAVVKDSFVEVRSGTDLFVFINLEDVAERDGHLHEDGIS